jgi:hypothetical protein
MMPQAMFDDPDGMLAMLRESAAGFAAQHSGTKSLRDKRASAGDLDKQAWKAMAEAGWTGLLLPEDFGGAGLGMREQAVLSEALGRALIAEPVAMAAVFSGILLANVSPSEERARLCTGIADGSVIAVPAWQNPSKSSHAKPVVAATTAVGFALTGEKHFVDAARSATDFLIVADSTEGCLLLSVPAATAGLAINQRPGIDGAIIASLSFAGCEVPESQVLSRAESADALLEVPILHTRLALAAELAGIASRALEITIAYTKDRVQFGKPIASFQAIQHRLVDMWSDAEFACAAVVNAVETLEAGDVRAAQLAVLAAKARAGDAAFSICRRALHLHGAMGFTDECDIGLYLKRAINLNATLGQSEALRLQFVELERAA